MYTDYHKAGDDYEAVYMEEGQGELDGERLKEKVKVKVKEKVKVKVEKVKVVKVTAR